MAVTVRHMDGAEPFEVSFDSSVGRVSKIRFENETDVSETWAAGGSGKVLVAIPRKALPLTDVVTVIGTEGQDGPDEVTFEA
jgi:hypothetical protein